VMQGSGRTFDLYTDHTSVRLSYPQIVSWQVYVSGTQVVLLQNISREKFGGSSFVNVLFIADLSCTQKVL